MSITSITSNTTARIVAGVVGIALAFTLAFAQPAHAAALSETQIQAIISLLQSFGADSATVANVNASLRGQATTGTGSTSGSSSSCSAFSRDLQVGSTGADVMALQKFLNANGAQVAASGAGSPGSETSTFGPATKAAVMKFQSANGISPVSGYVGPLTRAKMNSMCGGTTTNPNPTPSAGTGLSVMAAAQPANGLAPASTSRIPFTNFTVTAGNDGDVTITGVTVERTGAAVDSNFSGVVLIDQATGLQVGISKTLNSNHQAVIGDTITIPRGTSKTFTVAANRAAAGSHGGEVASFAVVSINTTATVSGSLPITGASHTINETLTVGSISTTTSSFDPGAAQTKNIGDTGVRFSGLRFTAGSGEDLKLYSLRFRQVGSVSSSDLSNVVVNVNGTDYPTTVDSTGKYYTITIPGGLLIAKGNSVDAYIKGDIVGSNAASRTADFDIDKVTDVYFVGQLYGYGIAPSGTYTPWYNGRVTTINAGSATTISKATEVAAQNIAINVPNQPLGGFVADFKGEAVSVSQMIFNFSYSSGAASDYLLTNVSLVDENGTVVAGPVDGVNVNGTQQKVTFTDSVTFKTGRHVYTLKGKVPTGVSNGVTIVASTTPSGWSSPTGQTSGNTITISVGNFSMNTMTIKSGDLNITMSTQPASQNIVAGGIGIVFGNVQLDASQSGEDVRISQLPLRSTNQTGLSNCQLFNGSTVLNTGSNVPTSLDGTDVFTFDNPLTVAKGTVLTLAIKCDTSTTATGTYVWSVNSGDSFTSTGITSGSTITPDVTTGNAGTMTVASGSLAVSVDPSSPATTTVASGSTGVTMAVIKLRASNEAINLQKLGLKLTGSGNTTSNANGGTTNSGVSDLVQVYLYDGATLVGTATFTGSGTSATSTLTSPVLLPKNADKTLTVKADLALIGDGSSGGIGDSVIIDPLNAEGSGASSGTTIMSGATAGAAGMKLFKSYPTLALDTSLPSTGAADGRLMRFKVTANAAGPVGINEFTFTVASTTGVTVTTVRLKAYTDASYSTAISGQGSGGQIGSDTANITSGTAFEIVPTTNPVQVPAGQTYYFELTGAVTGVDTGDSLVTTLSGDSSALTGLTSGYNVGTTTSSGEVGATAANFVWSGNSSTTAARTDVDWSNGFNIPGLPSGGLIQTRSN